MARDEKEEPQEDDARDGSSRPEPFAGPSQRDASELASNGAERSDSDEDRRGSRDRNRRERRNSRENSRDRSRGSRDRSREDSRDGRRRHSWGADRRDSPECDPYSIYLGGLSYDSDEAAIRSVFEEFGEVQNLKVMRRNFL